MNKSIKMIIPVLAVILLSACGGNENKKNNDNQNQKEAPSVKEVQKRKLIVKDDILNAIYPHYEHLTAALMEGDIAQAKVAAIAIEAGAKQIRENTSLASNTSAIINASDIEEQRAAYSKLSNDMIVLLKKAGMVGGELYVEFCPMALNDKGGSWISSTKEIHNPYFGEKMLKCGEVKETIK
jgi:PBP1b-binding outer membrane lipoprotein LpoB